MSIQIRSHSVRNSEFNYPAAAQNSLLIDISALKCRLFLRSYCEKRSSVFFIIVIYFILLKF